MPGNLQIGHFHSRLQRGSRLQQQLFHNRISSNFVKTKFNELEAA
jgi:hypothetical protein